MELSVLRVPDKLGLGGEQLKSAGVQVDLVLELVESGDKLTGHLEYCSDLFSPETATRMVGHLQVDPHNGLFARY